MNEPSPVGEVVLRFSAVVVENDALVHGARRDHGRHRRQEKRPIRRREHVDDVRRREPRQARQIDRLIDQRAQTTDVANPAERARKPGIDRDERHDVAVVAQRRRPGCAPARPGRPGCRGWPRQRPRAAFVGSSVFFSRTVASDHHRGQDPLVRRAGGRLRAMDRNVEHATAPELERQQRPQLEIEVASALVQLDQPLDIAWCRRGHVRGRRRKGARRARSRPARLGTSGPAARRNRASADR